MPVKVDRQAGGARALLNASLDEGTVGVAWLGQAGFVLKRTDFCCLIDPYLSNHLARKYAGTEFPHTRLMPPPVPPETIIGLDLVLCSHSHGDHMDPGSLPTIVANNPSCRVVVPRAEVKSAIAIGLSKTRLVQVSDGDTLPVTEHVSIHVVAAAHETLQTTARGEHRFLGFIVRMGRLKVYHAGDSLVYEGLAARLRSHAVDVALLPVNGRREELTSRGIIGNMTFDEAAALCAAASIKLMIPHHFGMFAFDTVDRAEIEARATTPGLGVQCAVPSTDTYYLLTDS